MSKNQFPQNPTVYAVREFYRAQGWTDAAIDEALAELLPPQEQMQAEEESGGQFKGWCTD